MEFSIPDCIANTLTQVFDRPVQGRVFFEEVVQSIFDRRVTRRTPSRYRTRVIADGVNPSPHVDYKHSRIKQYHNEGRALRTETVVNNTYDFDIGRRLCNLDDLKRIGSAANRRLLRVQRISHGFLGQLDGDGDGAQAPQEKRMLAEVQARSVDFVVLVRSATYVLIATHVMFHG